MFASPLLQALARAVSRTDCICSGQQLLDACHMVAVLLSRSAAETLGSRLGLALARAAASMVRSLLRLDSLSGSEWTSGSAYIKAARQLTAARGTFMRRLTSVVTAARHSTGSSADSTAALEAAYLRLLTPAASEADSIARANAQLAIDFMLQLLTAAVGITVAHATAAQAKAAAAAQLAAAASSTDPAAPAPAAVPLPLRLVCKCCHMPLNCQAVSLDILKNESIVHEVGVSGGTLQVKLSADAQQQVLLTHRTFQLSFAVSFFMLEQRLA
jgi:hypothetical protein